MSEDTIDVTLPSGKVAVVRNYTTRADDNASSAALYRGVNAASGKDGESVVFPLSNVMDSQDIYVRRLVKSIDGDKEFDLGELRSEDYQVLEKKVESITSKHSPKVPAA